MFALNGLAIMLIDAGCPTAYLALLERCIVLARADRLLAPLGRSLTNLIAEIYPQDLTRSAELASEALTVTRKAGDSLVTETALINASFVWWYAGDWDRLCQEIGEWVDGRPFIGSSGALLLSEGLVRLARGETPPGSDDVPDSEDSWERLSKTLALGLRDAQAGDVVGAATAVAAAVHALYARGDFFDDFEVMWAPAVELHLEAGALDEAEGMLALATPLLGVGAGRSLDVSTATARLDHCGSGWRPGGGLPRRGDGARVVRLGVPARSHPPGAGPLAEGSRTLRRGDAAAAAGTGDVRAAWRGAVDRRRGLADRDRGDC